jgi:hypothetical protein
MARWVVRVLLAAVVTSIIGLAVASALLQRPENVLDTEIVPAAPGRRLDSVDLGVIYLPDGLKRAQVGLWQADPQRIRIHPEIRLWFVTYDGSPELIHGELRIRGTSCSYETRPRATIANNAPLAFVRGPGCASAVQEQTAPRLDLTLTFRGRGHLGVLTYAVVPSASDPAWISLSDPATAGDALYVIRGRYVDYPSVPARRRVDLLAYAWRLPHTVTWIWILVGLSLLLIFAACLLISGTGSCTSTESSDAKTGLTRWAAAISVLGLGLALLYVILVPPLQAADEPDHALDFARVAGRPDVANGVAMLARVGHFERIRFHGDEHLRSADIGHPVDNAWHGPEIFVMDVAGRSTTTWLWWKLLAPLVQSMPAPGVVLAIRAANAIAFAVFLGLATLLLITVGAGTSRAPHAIALALLLVPTLPFFAIHFSEFALLTSCYVVLAAIVAASFLDGRRAHFLGLPLGLVVALVFGGGRSGLPLAPMFVALAAARALLGSPEDASAGPAARRAVIFWAGLGLGLASFPLLSTDALRHGLWPGDASAVPGPFRAAAEVLRNNPMLAVAAAPIGLLIELASGWIRRRLVSAGHSITSFVRVVAYGAAAAIAVSLVLSATGMAYPTLGLFEWSAQASARSYALEAVKVALTGARVSGHDLLLSLSFWEGFGWVDTLPGDEFVTVLVVLASAAAIGVLVCVARAGHVRRALWLGLLSCGWLASLVLFAVSSYYLHRNLHGRYLIGLYLPILATCGSSVALVPHMTRFTRLRRLGISREWLLASAAIIIHAWALRFILLRYF